MEWLYHPQRSYFMTFTYAPDKLPGKEIVNEDGNSCGTLQKQFFRQWLKNAQKDIYIGSFRYYAVGEYGDRSRRAHYHAAIFPQHPSQVGALRRRWEKRYGFTQAAEINHARAAYLAAYTTKKLTSSDDARLLKGQEPEFRISSRNPPLGAAMCEAIVDHYKNTRAGRKVISDRGDVERSFRVDGKTYPLGDWALAKIRRGLDIPLLHRDRLTHEGYYQYHQTEEAEWDPEKALTLEYRINAKKKQGHLRGKGQKI